VSAYYESGKPFRRSQWNLLISDLNELFQNPPGDCDEIDEIEEAEEDHVWTKEDVEEVREKMIEMCPDIEFDRNGEPLLEKPWSEEIIDEIEDQMDWCDCEPAGPTEIILADEPLKYCGTCCGFDDPEPVLVKDVIDGLQVAPAGTYGGTWRVYLGDTDNLGNSQVSGPILCDGTISYTSFNPVFITTGCVSYSFCGSGTDCEQLIEDLGGDEGIDGPNKVQRLRIFNGYRDCEEGDS
jgi:hypothetical protein